MHRDLIFDAAVLQPSDTATLKKATVEAIEHVSSAGPVARVIGDDWQKAFFAWCEPAIREH